MHEDDVALATSRIASASLGAEDGCADEVEQNEAEALVAATEEPSSFR
jgi:hypothetical protein